MIRLALASALILLSAGTAAAQSDAGWTLLISTQSSSSGTRSSSRSASMATMPAASEEICRSLANIVVENVGGSTVLCLNGATGAAFSIRRER